MSTLVSALERRDKSERHGCALRNVSFRYTITKSNELIHEGAVLGA